MAKQRRTGDEYYNEIKKIAEDNGGVLLSEKWINSKTKYMFAFSKDNLKEMFERRPDDLLRHGWPKDKNLYLKKSKLLSDSYLVSKDERYLKLKLMIEEKGGKIITDKWHGFHIAYDIIDEFGLENQVYAKCVFNNQWIANRGLVAQPICKQIFEHLFQETFIQTKKVLTAKILNRNRPFELDGYCEKLKIAFEYQGDRSHWDINHQKYLIVSERDRIKKQICEQLGVTLVQIPAFIDNKYAWSNEYLLEHVKKSITETFNDYNKDISHLNITEFKVNHKEIHKFYAILKEIENIAIANHAELLTKEITQYKTKLKFKTQDNIEFEMPLKTIRNRGWPKDINKYIKKSSTNYKSDSDFLHDMDRLARTHNAKLVSTKWEGFDAFYQFETNNGKILNLKQGNLIKNGWPKNISRYIIKE